MQFPSLWVLALSSLLTILRSSSLTLERMLLVSLLSPVTLTSLLAVEVLTTMAWEH